MPPLYGSDSPFMQDVRNSAKKKAKAYPWGVAPVANPFPAGFGTSAVSSLLQLPPARQQPTQPTDGTLPFGQPYQDMGQFDQATIDMAARGKQKYDNDPQYRAQVDREAQYRAQWENPGTSGDPYGGMAPFRPNVTTQPYTVNPRYAQNRGGIDAGSGLAYGNPPVLSPSDAETQARLDQGKAMAAIPVRSHPSEAYQQHLDAMQRAGAGIVDPANLQGPLPQASANGGSAFAPPLRGHSGETGPNDYDMQRRGGMVIPGAERYREQAQARKAEEARNQRAGATLVDADRIARSVFGGPLPAASLGASASVGPGMPPVYNNFEDWKNAKIAARKMAMDGADPNDIPVVGPWRGPARSPGETDPAAIAQAGAMRRKGIKGVPAVGGNYANWSPQRTLDADITGQAARVAAHNDYLRGQTPDQLLRRDAVTARARGVPVENISAQRLGDKASPWLVGAAYGPEVGALHPDVMDAARLNATDQAVRKTTAQMRMAAMDLPPEQRAAALKEVDDYEARALSAGGGNATTPPPKIHPADAIRQKYAVPKHKQEAWDKAKTWPEIEALLPYLDPPISDEDRAALRFGYDASPWSTPLPRQPNARWSEKPKRPSHPGPKVWGV